MHNPEIRTGPADERDLRRLFGCFPSGVTAVCAHDGERPIGIAASSFTSVSIEPPLVSICVSRTSSTWPRLRQRPRLGLSVLAHDQDATCRALAAKEGDRFAGVDWTTGPHSSLYVDGAVAWLECSIHAEVDGGDHTVVLLHIHGFGERGDGEPLVFHGSRFRRLARPVVDA